MRPFLLWSVLVGAVLPTGVGVVAASGIMEVQGVSGSRVAGDDPYSTSGTKLFDFNAGAFTLTFDSPVHAFGFYGIDAGGYGDQLFLTFTRASSSTETVAMSDAGGRIQRNGSIFFFGMIDPADAFTSVTFSQGPLAGPSTPGNPAVGEAPPPSSLQPSNVAPEPGSLLLLGSGLAGLGMFLRRRRPVETQA